MVQWNSHLKKAIWWIHESWSSKKVIDKSLNHGQMVHYNFFVIKEKGLQICFCVDISNFFD